MTLERERRNLVDIFCVSGSDALNYLLCQPECTVGDTDGGRLVTSTVPGDSWLAPALLSAAFRRQQMQMPRLNATTPRPICPLECY